jgi:hypothetical protein
VVLKVAGSNPAIRPKPFFVKKLIKASNEYLNIKKFSGRYHYESIKLLLNFPQSKNRTLFFKSVFNIKIKYKI